MVILIIQNYYTWEYKIIIIKLGIALNIKTDIVIL